MDEVETERTCKKCGETKPIEEYYELRTGQNGRLGHCRTCNNQRPPTETRIVGNRSRSRAYAELARRHHAEFTVLFEQYKGEALDELHELRQAAAVKRADDLALPRLKPGPKRNTDLSVLDRLDVARCPHCHQHHDNGHECQACGEIPEELVDPGLDVDYVAIERRMAGDRSIRLNSLETAELALLWEQSGRALNDMYRQTGIHPQRTIARAKSQAS